MVINPRGWSLIDLTRSVSHILALVHILPYTALYSSLLSNGRGRSSVRFLESRLLFRRQLVYTRLENVRTGFDLFHYGQHPRRLRMANGHRLAVERLGKDGHDAGQIRIVLAQHGRMIGLDQITQVAIDVDGLVVVLYHWQPGEPWIQE